jgi:outer membrane protein
MNQASRVAAKAISLFAIVLMVVPFLTAQPAGPEALTSNMTLPAAVDFALRSNPLMRATGWGQQQAAAHLGEAKAGRLPMLQIGETFSHGNNPVYVFGSLLEQGRFGMHNFDINSLNNPGSISSFRTSLALRLPIFNRFETASRIARAEIGVKQADSRTGQMQQQIRFKVIQAYYGVLVAEARVKVAEEAVQMAMADAKRIRDLYEVGILVASEPMAMEVQLSEFRQQQIQAQGGLVTAKAALAAALGLPIDSSFHISEELRDRVFDLPSQPELLQTALRRRPEYLQADLGVQSLNQELRSARGQYLPDLNLFASFGNSARSLTSGSSDFMTGVSVTFNILDFGRSARINQVQAVRSAAEAEKEHQADQIRLEVVQAYQNFLSARARLEVAAGALAEAEETLRIAQDRHEAGLTTLTELLRSQTTLLRARMNVLGARYDYYVGYAESLLASGQLDDVQAYVM